MCRLELSLPQAWIAIPLVAFCTLPLSGYTLYLGLSLRGSGGTHSLPFLAIGFVCFTVLRIEALFEFYNVLSMDDSPTVSPKGKTPRSQGKLTNSPPSIG